MKSMLSRSSRCSSCSSSSTAACTDVERRGDLVADQEVGPGGQRAGDGDPLALAARELDREAVPKAGGQLHAVEQLPHFAVGVGARQLAQHPQRPRDGRAHAVARVERLERVLEHDLDAAAHVERPLPGRARDGDAIERDLPGGRLVQPGDAAPDRRLAAAGLADQRDAAARLDGERDAVDRRPRRPAAAVAGLEPGDHEQRERRPGRGYVPATGAGRARARSISVQRVQRTWWPGAVCSSSGTRSWQRSCWCGQRGAKPQPPATRRRRPRRRRSPAASAGGGSRGWPPRAPGCTGGAAAR